MGGNRRPNRVEALVESLGAIAEPIGERERELIKEALGHKHWMAVARAARVVAEHGLSDSSDDLLAAWDRFIHLGPKADPGCRAKEELLRALDRLDSFDPDPFLAAIRYTQFEPVYGGSVDTAGGLRQRALFALLRQHHPHALLYAGGLLADPLVEVRTGAAEALGHSAGPVAAALLVQRLRTGDDARVLLACATALVELDAAFGRDLLADWLASRDEERREVAALAMGQSRDDGAADRLIAWLDTVTLERDLELGMRALALHRSERARQHLLECVEAGSEARARAAVRALANHMYDPQLRSRLREAAARRGDAAMIEEVERAVG